MVGQVISEVQFVPARISKDFAIGSVIEQLARELDFIHFYNQEDPFTEWLGNFYPVTVEYNGLVFPNSEAAFQAQKFIHRPDLMAEFTQLSGDDAFKRARELKEYIRSDWFDVNVETMKGILIAKIEQNPSLAHWLEGTGEALIVEHNLVKGRDRFWSDDYDGTGENRLGILWMEIRAKLRGEIFSGVNTASRGWQNYQQFLANNLPLNRE